MVGFAATVKGWRQKSSDGMNTVVKETAFEFGSRLVLEYTPFGDPLLWKAPPPADYRPGNLRSSWFFSVDRPNGATTDRVDLMKANDLDKMPERPAGRKLYFSNSAAHALPIEAGHSSQAPAGILVNAQEFSFMANAIARRVFSK